MCYPSCRSKDPWWPGSWMTPGFPRRASIRSGSARQILRASGETGELSSRGEPLGSDPGVPVCRSRIVYICLKHGPQMPSGANKRERCRKRSSFRPSRDIALDQIRTTVAADLGSVACGAGRRRLRHEYLDFRDGLTALGLQYVVGVQKV